MSPAIDAERKAWRVYPANEPFSCEHRTPVTNGYAMPGILMIIYEVDVKQFLSKIIALLEKQLSLNQMFTATPSPLVF